jgi:hypothetical protein
MIQSAVGLSFSDRHWPCRFSLGDRTRLCAKRLCVAALPLAAATILAAAGCGGGSSDVPRFNVSGTVTYKGQPVPDGVIQFLPDSAKGNDGPATNATIVNGSYDTATSGRGTVGGPHIVIIQGFDGQARPEDELPYGMPLFDDYRSHVDLPESDGEVMNFEVQP